MKKLMWFSMFLFMFVGIATSAQGITIIEKPAAIYEAPETVDDVIRYGKALILETVDMTSNKPTLLFFGGKGERSSARATAKLLDGAEAFSGWNVCYIAVSRDKGYIREWKEVASALREYISQRVREGKIDPNNLYIDAYSNGAAGGFYTALELHNMPIHLSDGNFTEVHVKEFTLIEGTLPGIIKSPQVEQLLNMEIPVTMYVSEGSTYNLSAHGRDLVKEFNERKNFTGILVNHGHGSAIVALVSYSYGNHAYDGWL